MLLPKYVSLARVQQVIGDRVTVKQITPNFARVLIDEVVVGAYYPHGYVSGADLAGSHLTDDELERIEVA